MKSRKERIRVIEGRRQILVSISVHSRPMTRCYFMPARNGPAFAEIAGGGSARPRMGLFVVDSSGSGSLHLHSHASATN
jgi:hypothetical protein